MAVEVDLFHELVHHFEPYLLVGLLPSAKAKLDADFEVIAEKLDGLVPFHPQIVGVDGGGDLKLFHSAGGLPGARIFAVLGFLVKELAVIDNAADGRRGVGGNLDQVQAFALCQTKGVIEGHDPQLLFGLVDDPDFAGTDLPVPAMQGFARMKGARRERAAQSTPRGWRLFMQGYNARRDGNR